MGDAVIVCCPLYRPPPGQRTESPGAAPVPGRPQGRSAMQDAEEVLPLDQYRKLLSNTVLFGISTFGAKFLSFLLTPFYTRVLSSAEYGVTDLLLQTGNLIIPLASVGIANAVIRFGLERSSDKNSVFTTGILVTLTGSLVLLLAAPLLGRIEFLSDYLWLVMLYVLMADLHSVCNQFARAMGHIRLFAVDGILGTALAVGFNILFLAVFRMGVSGYVLANVLADGLTAVFVFCRARQWRYFRLSSLTRARVGQMLRYSAPLVPSTLCGWIINISDRYLIALLVSSTANGIYAVANKLPNILLTVANIFSSAWQLSALAEQPRAGKERFFSNVCSVYAAIAFSAASGVILTAQISTRILAAPEYFEAWRYVPVLTLATTFACLGSFLASIYMVEQRSSATLATTVLGAVTNIIGNALLIPLWGPMGAAISTLGSYVLIFGVRAVHSRSMLRVRWDLPRFLSSVVLLALQCVLMELDVALWPLWASLCALGVVAVNGKPLWSAVRSIL